MLGIGRRERDLKVFTLLYQNKNFWEKYIFEENFEFYLEKDNNFKRNLGISLEFSQILREIS